MSEQTAQAALVETGAKEKVFDFQDPNATLEDFEAELTTNSEFREEYLNDGSNEKYSKFNQLSRLRESGQYTPGQQLPADQSSESSITDGNGGQPGQNTAPDNGATDANSTDQTSQSSESTTEGDSITITISKDLLGTYLTGRSDSEAVVEALKGKTEADKTIRTLIDEKKSVLDENQSLRSEILQYMDKAGQQPNVPQVQPIEEITFDGNLDDLDPFDEEDHKKLVNHVKRVQERDSKYNQQLNQQSTDNKQGESEKGKTDTPEVRTARENLYNGMIKAEFADIQSLQAVVPELQTSLSFDALNELVLDTHKKIGIVAGNPAKYMNAVEIYLSDSPEGQSLREKCKSQNITLPPDYEKYQAILKLRGQRENDIAEYMSDESKRLGRKVERYEIGKIPNSSYHAYFLRNGGDVSKIVPTFSWNQPVQQAQPTPQPSPAPQPQQQPAPAATTPLQPAPQQNPGGNSTLHQTIQQHSQQGNQPAPAHAKEVPNGMGSEHQQVLMGGMTEQQFLDTAALACSNPMSVTPDVAKFVVEKMIATPGIGQEGVPQALIRRSKE